MSIVLARSLILKDLHQFVNHSFYSKILTKVNRATIHSSIFVMTAVMVRDAIVWTGEQIRFVSIAIHVVQEDAS